MSSYYHHPSTGQVRPAAMRCAKQRDCAPIHILLQFMSKVYNIWNVLLYYVNMYYCSLHKKGDSDIMSLSLFVLWVLETVSVFILHYDSNLCISS